MNSIGHSAHAVSTVKPKIIPEEQHKAKSTRKTKIYLIGGISTFNTKQNNIDVIKCTEKPAEVLVQTSEISKKFKFFETYRPVENKRRIFRITPPREGVVNLPSPEMERKISLTKQSLSETHDLERSHMTSLMITKFRELENGLQPHIRHGCFRTIKHLTPPIEQKRKWDAGSDYDTDDGVDYVSSEDSNENAEDSVIYLDHQILREAQTTTRAKQLCARFENWQIDEIDRRVNDGPINANLIFASEDRTSEVPTLPGIAATEPSITKKGKKNCSMITSHYPTCNNSNATITSPILTSSTRKATSAIA
uniref:Uncharacterized protein n=1 Tax=Glossina palpalis gambiensis TaxID=67801 RepID=A0A1B0BP79_9MUSC